MSTILVAEERKNLNKAATKGYRQEGKIPAVLYGKGKESKAVAVNERDFIKTVQQVGRNGIISLTVGDGQAKHEVFVQETQVDPIKGNIIHIDFFEVDMNQEMEASVPVVLEGEAPGARSGGVVTQLLHEITVRSLPNEIPERVAVDISQLNIGDTLLIKDIIETVPAEVVNDEEEALVTVVVASSGESAEQAEGEAEPELVSTDSDEGTEQ